jgi:hypothetical protein
MRALIDAIVAGELPTANRPHPAKFVRRVGPWRYTVEECDDGGYTHCPGRMVDHVGPFRLIVRKAKPLRTPVAK